MHNTEAMRQVCFVTAKYQLWAQSLASWQAPIPAFKLSPQSKSMCQTRQVRHWVGLVEIAQLPSQALARAGVMGGSIRMPNQDFFSSPTPEL